MSIVIGIDAGTSGVRGVAADPTGLVLASHSASLRPYRDVTKGVHEQDSKELWAAVCDVTLQLMSEIKDQKPAHELLGVCVTSTSGSLLLTDDQGSPLRPLILYDDSRSVEAAKVLNESCGTSSWNTSHSLAKALWVRAHEPDVWARTKHLLHPADWLTGQLTGQFGLADYSNALKLGYDPGSSTWAPVIDKVGLAFSLLPRITRPGSQVGRLCREAASETCLPYGTPVVAGATDGIAGLLASGAWCAGDANTTLGTTLVWKVLTEDRPSTNGRVYSHLHPSGLWAPGAASNTGPGSLSRIMAATSPQDADRMASAFLPSTKLCYPLAGRGERFPFVAPSVEPFRTGSQTDVTETYASELQALAFVERWGYEIIAQSCPVASRVFSAGGAARSSVFSQLRANVLGRSIHLCAEPSAAFGASILAATVAAFGGDVVRAIRGMTKVEQSWEPEDDLSATFDDLYRRFRNACTERGLCG